MLDFTAPSPPPGRDGATRSALEVPLVPARFDVPILPQPDDLTCGPTCLHAVYRFWGDEVPLEEVIEGVDRLENQGTLGVLLGIAALKRGYRAVLYSYNLAVFDPSWFDAPTDLSAKLRAQADAKQDPRLRRATHAYLEFLDLGGQVCYETLSADLVRRILQDGTPILTGLSATYLYDTPRERDVEGNSVYDDVAGEPAGHFVVVSGWDPDGTVTLSDPLRDNPRFGAHHYSEQVDQVLYAVLLGALTYDANFLVVRP